MRTPEDYSKKLFIARDLEGNFEKKSFRAAELVDARLEKYPFYVGTRIYGSTLKGYALPDNYHSDIDLRVIYDTDKIDKDELRDMDFYADIERLQNDFGEDNHPLQNANIVIYPISIHDIAAWMHDGGNMQMATVKLAQLGALVKGKKVDEYRRLAREYIKGLDDDRKETLIQDMASALMFEDSRSEPKYIERLNITKDEFHQIMAARRRQWVKRLRTVYDVPANE